MIYSRIKALRENGKMTQSDLAKQLGVTRSSVNAWEMGISVPSVPYLIELAKIFHVSTDYLLGLKDNLCIDVSGLTDDDVSVVHEVVSHLRSKNQHIQH